MRISPLNLIVMAHTLDVEGLDRERILKRCQLDPSSLLNEDGEWVPAEHFADMIRVILAETADPAFGLIAGKSLALPLTGELRSLQQATVPNGTAKLKLSNPGNLPLYYGWAETGYERNLPDTAVTHGLEITQAILDEKGNAISEARIGQEVTVRLTVRALDRDSARQVVLVNVLPSGLEPVLNSGSSDDEAPDTPLWQRRVGGTGSWSLNYVDIREDRLIFFGDVGRGTQDISFKARATNVGQFALPAAYAEAMYERRVYGRSAAGRFHVAPLGK